MRRHDLFAETEPGTEEKQRSKADHPLDMWTTVPPAKSIARILALEFQTPFIRPSMPQTIWANGK